MSEFIFPMGRHAANIHFRQSYHYQHLPTCDQELSIAWPVNGKAAPESASLKTLQFAVNHELVPKLSGSSIVDFRSDNDRAVAVIEHLAKRPTKFFREQRTICLNEPEIIDIMDHATRVCVEKHHLDLGL